MQFTKTANDHTQVDAIQPESGCLNFCGLVTGPAGSEREGSEPSIVPSSSKTSVWRALGGYLFVFRARLVPW